MKSFTPRLIPGMGIIATAVMAFIGYLALTALIALLTIVNSGVQLPFMGLWLETMIGVAVFGACVLVIERLFPPD